MRVTLWQQFSSNHSAMYTVVGVFQSADAARMAGEKIRQSVVEVAAWYEQNKEQLKTLGGQPNPVEEALAQAYHFDWKEPVDWLVRFPRYFYAPYQREPEEHIMTYDRLVIVDAPGASSTYQTGHQFANLIVAMGGQVYSSVFMGEHPDDYTQFVFESIEFDLQCTAPTVELAIEIHRQIESQLDSKDDNQERWLPIPWITYHLRYAYLTGNMPKDQFEKVEQIWIQEHKAWSEFVRSHQQTWDAQKKERWRSFITQDEQLDNVIGYLRSDTALGKGECYRRDNVIELKAVEGGFGDALIALTAWMQARGCGVDYQFRQVENT